MTHYKKPGIFNPQNSTLEIVIFSHPQNSKQSNPRILSPSRTSNFQTALMRTQTGPGHDLAPQTSFISHEHSEMASNHRYCCSVDRPPPPGRNMVVGWSSSDKQQATNIIQYKSSPNHQLQQVGCIIMTRIRRSAYQGSPLLIAHYSRVAACEREDK